MSIKTHIYMILRYAAFAVIAAAMHACQPAEDPFFINRDSYGGNPGNRVTTINNRRVVLLYEAGYNSLSEDLKQDINDVLGGWLPPGGQTDNVLLVYTHNTARNGQYSTLTNPYLLRLSSGADGTAKIDTLVTYPESTISSSAEQLNYVLTYVKDNFPAKSYGMTFSSHATGYLPAGFYGMPDRYVYQQKRAGAKGEAPARPGPVPYYERNQDPSLPRVRSVGQEQRGSYGNYESYEIDIKDFAEAIPMKLDFLIFDACLMGGIEVAYELREKCGKIGFSQAEVLAEGLDYTRITPHLLGGTEADLESICNDYFLYYDSQNDRYMRSATTSLIDCSRLEPLAQVCKDIFSSHRDGLDGINPSKVQRYYRSNHHWFYDLESVIINAGASGQELEALYAALEECVIYKAHTPEFLCEFEITTFSGFSMYLPCHGTRELDKYYRTLEWNKATELVE